MPIIIEVAQPDGPYGARGVGEHTMIPAAAMVANAVEDAVGLRVKRLPITAEKVALELHGIRYDDVKGSYMGLCFAGQPDAYAFRTTRAEERNLHTTAMDPSTQIDAIPNRAARGSDQTSGAESGPQNPCWPLGFHLLVKSKPCAPKQPAPRPPRSASRCRRNGSDTRPPG